MSTNELLLAEMKGLAGRLTNIETAVVSIARQDEKIANIQQQIAVLFKKNDQAFNPKDGVVTEIKVFQKSCPKKEVLRTMNRQWAAIALLAAITTGSLLKALGVY